MHSSSNFDQMHIPYARHYNLDSILDNRFWKKFQKFINIGPLIRPQGLEKSQITKCRTYVYSRVQSNLQLSLQIAIQTKLFLVMIVLTAGMDKHQTLLKMNAKNAHQTKLQMMVFAVRRAKMDMYLMMIKQPAKNAHQAKSQRMVFVVRRAKMDKYLMMIKHLAKVLFRKIETNDLSLIK